MHIGDASRCDLHIVAAPSCYRRLGFCLPVAANHRRSPWSVARHWSLAVQCRVVTGFIFKAPHVTEFDRGRSGLIIFFLAAFSHRIAIGFDSIRWAF